MTDAESALPPPTVPGLSNLSVLARGGYATVYRAIQDSVSREVAVKVENRALLSERERRGFLREARAAGRMSSHPHVVDLFDAGVTAGGHPYLIMELCDGSYAERMKSAPLSPFEARDVGVKIADALADAHALGVLHRDVKPANILITRFGEPALADFGLAVITEARDLSVTMDVLTPAYAPPELFRHRPPSAAVDVYALCATLYALMHGRPPRWPRDRDPSLATLIDLFNEPVADLPGVLPEFVEVLRAGMANDPLRRPSAAEVRDRLAALDLGSGASSMPVYSPRDASDQQASGPHASPAGLSPGQAAAGSVVGRAPMAPPVGRSHAGPAVGRSRVEPAVGRSPTAPTPMAPIAGQPQVGVGQPHAAFPPVPRPPSSGSADVSMATVPLNEKLPPLDEKSLPSRALGRASAPHTTPHPVTSYLAGNAPERVGGDIGAVPSQVAGAIGNVPRPAGGDINRIAPEIARRNQAFHNWSAVDGRAKRWILRTAIAITVALLLAAVTAGIWYGVSRANSPSASDEVMRANRPITAYRACLSPGRFTVAWPANTRAFASARAVARSPGNSIRGGWLEW